MKTKPPPDESLAGHYAGPITRLTAYVIDASVSVALYGTVLSLIALLSDLLFNEDFTSPGEDTPVWALGLVVWLFAYYGVSWALTGKTIGKALLGLRIVRRNGADLEPSRGLLRAAVYPVSFLILGLGLVGVVIGRERRALHDVIADTTVVYDWDARAARWRILNRSQPLERAEASSSGARSTGDVAASTARSD